MISNDRDSSVVHFREINTLNDAMVLRNIRNECRMYMTRSSDIISEEQQKKWFEGLDRDNIKLFLMAVTYQGVAFDIMGFGYCKADDNEVYLTGGLTESYRGRGYGRILFSHLLETAKSFNKPITLEVLNSNVAARELYSSLGFVPTKVGDTITSMEWQE